MPPRRFVLYVLILIVLAGCVPSPAPSLLYATWNPTDLRVLDAANAAVPTLDLLAAYTRQRGPEWQVRLDLLEMNSTPGGDLYLALDTGPGGTNQLPLQETAAFAWDTLLVIPAAGQIEALSPDPEDESHTLPRPGMRIRVVRDPVLDTLDISFNRQALDAPLGFRLQVFITPAGSKLPVDSLGPLLSDGAPPPPAYVMFAFWNCMPAYTPAQALRRWDGAHTGPWGGRHGLYNLLRAVRGTGTPVALLDLKLPVSLAALDSVGGSHLVSKLSSDGLLILPENLPGFPGSELPAPLPNWAQLRAAAESRQAGLAFGLHASQFGFAPLGLAQAAETLAPYERAVFVPAKAEQAVPEPVAMGIWGSLRVIPVPGYDIRAEIVQQASLGGPTLPLRRALVQAALEAGGDSSRFLVLGGNLPASTWGNPNAAMATLKYLAAHPWIRVLGEHDLLAANPAGAAVDAYQPMPPVHPTPQDSLVQKLQAAPDNPIAEAAWQAYLALFAPTFPTPDELPALRARYLGQVGVLLAAADWTDCQAGMGSDNPDCPPSGKTQLDCVADPDLDGQDECILASKDFFGVFEIQGGYLAYAFARTPSGAVHQWAAPSSQLLTGLSEASTWNLATGITADPQVFPGAFLDLNPSGTPAVLDQSFQVEPEPDGLTLVSPDGTLASSFQLTSTGLQVTYRSERPLRIQIPLVLDPWRRFTPGWIQMYQTSQGNENWSWEVLPASNSTQSAAPSPTPQEEPFRMEIRTTAVTSLHTFKDSQDFLELPENPNRDYPAGHFLPFPLALVEIDSPGSFSVQATFLGPDGIR